MPSEQDQASGLKLGLNEDDVREFCKISGLPYVMVFGAYRRFASATENKIGIADVLYMLVQAKAMGLDPFGGEWLSPVPKEGGKGFSLCFRLDAAYYIINHHPDVEYHDYCFYDGTGKRLNKTDEARLSFLDKNPVDWGLTCAVTIKLKSREKATETVCSFSQWVPVKDGAPKYMWRKMAGHMLRKQTYKEAVRQQLGACLVFEDQVGHPQLGSAETDIPVDQIESAEPTKILKAERLPALPEVTAQPETQVQAAPEDAERQQGPETEAQESQPEQPQEKSLLEAKGRIISYAKKDETKESPKAFVKIELENCNEKFYCFDKKLFDQIKSASLGGEKRPEVTAYFERPEGKSYVTLVAIEIEGKKSGTRRRKAEPPAETEKAPEAEPATPDAERQLFS